jgi:hypothetical protein
MKLTNIFLVIITILVGITFADGAGTMGLKQIIQPGNTDFNFGDHNVTGVANLVVDTINGTPVSSLGGSTNLSNVLNKSSTTYVNETAINSSIAANKRSGYVNETAINVTAANVTLGQAAQNGSISNLGAANTAQNITTANLALGQIYQNTTLGNIALGQTYQNTSITNTGLGQTAQNGTLTNIALGQTWQNTSLTNNGLSHAAINSTKANMLNNVVNKTMGSNVAGAGYDITGIDDLNATEVYSGGELQRNQTQFNVANIYLKNGYTIAENSSGYIIAIKLSGTMDEYVFNTTADYVGVRGGGVIGVGPGHFYFDRRSHQPYNGAYRGCVAIEYNNTKFIGSGPATVIDVRLSQETTMFDEYAFVFGHIGGSNVIDSVGVESMRIINTFNGIGVGNFSCGAIWNLDAVRNSTFRDLIVGGPGCGPVIWGIAICNAYGSDAYKSKNNLIEDITIYNAQKSAIFLRGADSNIVHNIRVVNVKYGIYYPSAISIGDDASAYTSNNNLISDINIDSMEGDTLIEVIRGNNNSISNVLCTNSSGNIGIGLINDVSGNLFSDITFVNCPNVLTTLDVRTTGKYNEFDDMKIDRALKRGIYIENTNSTIFRDVFIRNTGDSGQWLPGGVMVWGSSTGNEFYNLRIVDDRAVPSMHVAMFLHDDTRSTVIDGYTAIGYTTHYIEQSTGATYTLRNAPSARNVGARLLLTGTSQAVAHGLAITPTNQSINVVKESSGTDWWFSAAPTSTDFYINGTAGKYVDWSIN